LINKEAINMMIINFPDMGFSNSQNINVPDKFYVNIKENIVRCVQLQRFRKETSDYQLHQSMICNNGEGPTLNKNLDFASMDANNLLQGSTSLAT
jgi:hypothetical protein